MTDVNKIFNESLKRISIFELESSKKPSNFSWFSVSISFAPQHETQTSAIKLINVISLSLFNQQHCDGNNESVVNSI